MTLIELMIVVAITGVLCAIAIPSYIRYTRRSKSVEAISNLRRLYDSSIAYYETDRSEVGNTGVTPKQFPTSAGPSPAANACCGQPGDKCLPNPATFQGLTWAALNFSVDDPYYYWYEYLSAGVDTAATFQAYAYGNLDCDTIYATYMRPAKVLADRTVTGAPGLYIENDIE